MTTLSDGKFSGRILLLAALLVIAATIPRLYNLGEQGFYMDEETTAFAARALLEEKEAQMPSGMPYHRALPYTWLNSMSAKIFGADKEFSYRLPAAIFGILAVPLLFLLARPYVGTSVAFLAALLLGLSEWHIITSRQARMYAPFLFFYTACTFSLLQWAKKDEFKLLVIATSLFMITVSLHSLGVFAAFIPLVALFIKGYARTPYYKLIAFSIMGGSAAYLYRLLFVRSPYKVWKETNGILTNNADSTNALSQLLHTNNLLAVVSLAGIFLGIWLAKKSAFQDTENGKEFRLVTRYVLAIMFGWLSVSGNIHGAFLSILLMMMLYPGSVFTYVKQTYKPLLAISVLAVITIATIVTDIGLVPGIKSILSFPYPYWVLFAEISLGITILFVSTLAFLALKEKSNNEHAVMAVTICALFPLIIVGIIMKWAPARYLLPAYPFILISSMFMLYYLSNKATEYFSIRSKSAAIAISLVIGLSGLLGGHGLVQAYKSGKITYGNPFNEAAISFPFYPDHKYPGEFVSKHRKIGDIVIAEDVLEQRWYAGKVDYWLRKYDPVSGGHFLYRGKDQNLHDIYVGSIVATTEILETLTKDKNRRIWLITSGETYSRRDLYLREGQLQWLENIELNYSPVFTGKDKITQVYCLGCEILD